MFGSQAPKTGVLHNDRRAAHASHNVSLAVVAFPVLNVGQAVPESLAGHRFSSGWICQRGFFAVNHSAMGFVWVKLNTELLA